MLECSCIVLADVKNLVMNILHQFVHEVIVPLENARNHSLDFLTSEKGTKRNFAYLSKGIEVHTCILRSQTTKLVFF
jgi:hypothetical protein